METCSSNFVSKLTKFLLRIPTLSILSRFFLLLIVFSLVSQNVVSQNKKGKQSFTVVIDPGHGGKDSGALGSFTQEKGIVLRLALKL
ncbi:MAG TPA: N-acetylmuramoyl-L-alanine amidase, partial [Salinivirgaceae bacterium]|nr:N-acetylmuramoyl-L-alanine amidase [Salinivirgaceae bacterium]